LYQGELKLQGDRNRRAGGTNLGEDTTRFEETDLAKANGEVTAASPHGRRSPVEDIAGLSEPLRVSAEPLLSKK
jgi:hypothetical protein